MLLGGHWLHKVAHVLVYSSSGKRPWRSCLTLVWLLQVLTISNHTYGEVSCVWMTGKLLWWLFWWTHPEIWWYWEPWYFPLPRISFCVKVWWSCICTYLTWHTYRTTLAHTFIQKISLWLRPGLQQNRVWSWLWDSVAHPSICTAI